MGDRTRFSSSAFSPAAARQTSVTVLRNKDTGDHRLVTSISTRKSTEVLRINLRTGRLELENDAIAESSYENESEAADQLRSQGFEVVEPRGYALLGYAAVGPVAGLLLATRVRQKAVLPGGHTVYAVTDSQWVIVPLQNEATDAATAAALAGLPPPRCGDVEFWRAVQHFTLNNAHYYCETADISRPFPSDKDPREPSPEFVWNSWLRQPLVELGLYDHCPALLQGAVECSTQQHPSDGRRFSMCLISRRSRRHPGTRYIARGLNSLAGPGNEIESELLTWTHPEQQHYVSDSRTLAGADVGGCEPLKWARVVWRRGTVPIWWGVQLQSLAQGLQAEVYVREEHPYHGTASYFRNVQRQHTPRPALPHLSAAASVGPAPGKPSSINLSGGEGWTLVEGDAAGSSLAAAGAAAEGPGNVQPGQQQGVPSGDEASSLSVPITCINLLHANPKKASELMLSSHFQDAMRHVRRRLGGGAPIRVVNFDWHGNMGRLSEEKAVEGFWSLMEPFVKETGFASGWMEAASGTDGNAAPSGRQQICAATPAAGSNRSIGGPGSILGATGVGPGGGAAPAIAAAAAPATSWPPGWRMRWVSQQSGVLRFNCADSLDRTNAATCFAMLPVLQEQLRVLGITLECAVPPATAALLRSRQRSSTGDVAGLAGQQPQQGPANVEEAALGLPEGWEVRQHEGRLLYIDHVNRTTQWTHPAASPGAGASPEGGGGGRPGSATALGSRVMQSASDMLARLQRQAASPSGATPLQAAASGRLDRRFSPPRAPTGRAHSPDHHRSGSASSLNGGSTGGGGVSGVPHAASAPDVVVAAAVMPDRDPLRPWAFFEYGMSDVRERLLKEAVSDYVEMFRVHGDIHSFLYTGSPAMHSHVLNLVVQGGKGYGATSGVGKLQNLRVAVQRRWNNTVSDTSRQQAMELFLGLRIHDSTDQKGYFPGLQIVYRDNSQAQLGGMESFELAPLPPLSAGPSAKLPAPTPGPLAAGAAAAASQQSWQQLGQGEGQGPLALEEQGLPGGEAESGDAGEDDDRAHAVPGVPAVEHDGVLGVRQSLLDLEPLPDPPPEQQQRPSSAGLAPAGSFALGASTSSDNSSSSRLGDVGTESSTSEAPEASPAFDPLGAAAYPAAPTTQHHEQQRQQQRGGELISLEDDTQPGDGSPPHSLNGAAPTAANVRSQLQDLLL